MKISASYLSSIFDKKSTIKLLDESSTDLIHVDIMDGKFVPSKNFTAEEVIEDLKGVLKPIEIHLMTYEPEKYIEKLIELNPQRIIFHLESNTDIESVIKILNRNNIEVGIAIKPNTEIMYLDNYLDKIDFILVMTVEPGAGGQRFMFDMEEKIKDLNDLRYNKDYAYKIGVDGGVNEYSALKCKKDGADELVVGSYICRYENFNERINNLRKVTRK